ncbi:unnamed protein product [Paramecium sonneborni]|uniref:Uncharacterized protein n=1 Tax=Paramecium sonneborni TaxID=65129 RepID=A0A8S1M300_9CILI|nr:unnamed protein product [Paramecium sonneborni]
MQMVLIDKQKFQKLLLTYLKDWKNFLILQQNIRFNEYPLISLDIYVIDSLIKEIPCIVLQIIYPNKQQYNSIYLDCLKIQQKKQINLSTIYCIQESVSIY